MADILTDAERGAALSKLLALCRMAPSRAYRTLLEDAAKSLATSDRANAKALAEARAAFWGALVTVLAVGLPVLWLAHRWGW